MDEAIDLIKEELRSDVTELANSTEFKELLAFLVKQWIGNYITDPSLTLLSFIKETIKREFDFEQSFYDTLEETFSVNEQTVPFVTVAKGDTKWYVCENHYKITEIKFLKSFAGYSEPKVVGKYNVKSFSTIKFENEGPIRSEDADYLQSDLENGELRIEVFGKLKKSTGIPLMKSKSNLIGVCTISLSEALKNRHYVNEWPIFNATQKVGFVKLIITYDKKTDLTPLTLKERFNRLIVDRILEKIGELQKSTMVHALKQEIVSDTPFKNKVKPECHHIIPKKQKFKGKIPEGPESPYNYAFLCSNCHQKFTSQKKERKTNEFYLEFSPKLTKKRT